MCESHILVVDDEPEIIELIELYLTREGYCVHSANNGIDALRLAAELEPDLIILDIQLKSMNGIEVCKQLRERSEVPILFVSCKSDDTDIIHGLSIGGDDYMTKPFSPLQLVARVKAHLRRKNAQESLLHPEAMRHRPTVLRYENLIIDTEAYTVHAYDRPVTLSAKEFELLLHLASHPNKAFHLEKLYQEIWGTESIGDTRTLMVHISNLRKKIETDPANPQFIVTVRGVGYKFISREGNENVYR